MSGFFFKGPIKQKDMKRQETRRQRSALEPYGALKDCANVCGVTPQTVRAIVRSGFTRGNAETINLLRRHIAECGYIVAKGGGTL